MNHEAANGRQPGEQPYPADEGIAKRADEYTGRYLVLLDPAEPDRGMAQLRSGAGVARARRVRASEAESTAAALDESGAVLIEGIGVGIVTVQPDQRESLRATAQEKPAVLAMEPERVLYASHTTIPGTTPQGTATADYLRGYQHGVEELVQHALERMEIAEPAAAALAAGWDESDTTWGVQATRAAASTLGGRGVKVAVLDTGVDTAHPDLAGRFGAWSSFVPGEDVIDGHGHGTHCTGTACGPRTPAALPRFGVACEAEICAGKVLSNQGSGTDGQILAGVDWAIGQGCTVVSLSLGSPARVGRPPSRIWEQVARRALRAGTVLVAAAGNDSDRPARTEPVGHPANCPSVLAVGALTRDLTIAFFSNAGLSPGGGQVDLAAPGVDVLSSWPGSGYQRLMGTSMATPHVAGVLALLAEDNPSASAAELKSLLLAGARRLPLPAVDVGAGLVQAP